MDPKQASAAFFSTLASALAFVLLSFLSGIPLSVEAYLLTLSLSIDLEWKYLSRAVALLHITYGLCAPEEIKDNGSKGKAKGRGAGLALFSELCGRLSL